MDGYMCEKEEKIYFRRDRMIQTQAASEGGIANWGISNI